MDSTMVSQIAQTAVQLGITAKQAYVIYLLTNIAGNLIVAGTIVLCFNAVASMIRGGFRGYELMKTICSATGRSTNYDHTQPTTSDYAYAVAVLADPATYAKPKLTKVG